MCTRYLLLQEHYRQVLKRLGLKPPERWETRYNIAPGTSIPAIRRKKKAAENESIALRWGLVPSWAKADHGTQLTNARAETLEEKPSFRDAAQRRRCVIPASGFYEWETIGRAKQPWWFRRKDERPFVFAGVWEEWRMPDGNLLESCAVVTTTPNDLMRPIHHRMPVILSPAQAEKWLDPDHTDVPSLAPIMQAVPADVLTASRVSSFVSRVQNEGPECLAPATNAPQLSFGL